MKSQFASNWLSHAVQGAAALALATALFFAWGGVREAEAATINVLTVDCTPLVSPGGTAGFGPQNTMGMALQSVDQGGPDFNVTEDTPAAFRARSAAQLSSFDLIAINNHPKRLGDGCVLGAGSGLGTTWQGVIGVISGGRVVLNSHDTPRFHILPTPGGPPLFTGFEPFGAPDLLRQAALWAGGGSQTGLLIFNDSKSFAFGVGWDNPELNLPAAWGISDLSQGVFIGGGYTDILSAFAAHPIYVGLSDVRGAANTVSSYSANACDDSFDSIFGSFNAAIFTPTEVVINTGVLDVGGLGTCGGSTVPGPDGTAITLIRDAGAAPPTPPPPTPPPLAPVGGTVELVSGSSAAADSQQSGRGPELGLAAMTIALAGLAGFMGLGWVVRRRTRTTN